jgi:hypothetical protein
LPAVSGGVVGGTVVGGGVSGGSLVGGGAGEGELVGGDGDAGGLVVGTIEVWVGAGLVAVGPMVDGMIGGPSPLAGAAVG